MPLALPVWGVAEFEGRCLKQALWVQTPGKKDNLRNLLGSKVVITLTPIIITDTLSFVVGDSLAHYRR